VPVRPPAGNVSSPKLPKDYNEMNESDIPLLGGAMKGKVSSVFY
jgi:hypothetical protein